jgi:protein-tyrosine phosphatase
MSAWERAFQSHESGNFLSEFSPLPKMLASRNVTFRNKLGFEGWDRFGADMQDALRLGTIVTALLTACGCSAAHDDASAALGGHAIAMPRTPGLMAPSQAGGSAGPEPEPEPEPDPPAGACEPHQFVLAGHVQNARDLGGLPTAPEGQVACGSLFRGPPLAGLTQAGCSEVAALGIRTVIDLRIESERTTKPNSACVGADQVFAPLPIPYGVSPAEYSADLNAPAIAAAFQAFTDPDAYPIYFHCTWGRDRTGVVAALLLLSLGASREDVMQEYLLSKTSVGAYPDSLTAVLDEIEQRGGADAVLSEIGIESDALEALRGRAVVTAP